MTRPNPQLCAVVVLWGFNFVALKVLYPEMAPPVVGLLRWAVMQAVLVVWCLIRKEPLRYEKGDAWRVLGVGCLSMGIYMVAFLEGMLRTTASDGAIVMATAPLLTYLLACWVRQDRFVPKALAGSMVAFAGVVVVILSGSGGAHGSLGGNAVVFLAAILWAWAAVASRSILHGYAPVRMFTLSLPGALPPLLLYGIVPTLHQDFGRVSGQGWFMLATVVFGSGLIGFALFYVGIQKIGAARAALYQYFVPLMALLFAWVVMGTAPALPQIVGLALVLTGVLLANNARVRAAIHQVNLSS